MAAPTRKPARPRATAKATTKATTSTATSATQVREPAEIAYGSAQGFEAFVQRISAATPMELVLTERAGVQARLIKDLARHLDMPASRLFAILGVAKATAEKKVAAGESIGGQGGHAVLGLVRLLGMAQALVANSTAVAAASFDAAKWLGRWLELPQPSLGGRRPAELLDTPTGVELVARVLGALESGAYQ